VAVPSLNPGRSRAKSFSCGLILFRRDLIIRENFPRKPEATMSLVRYYSFVPSWCAHRCAKFFDQSLVGASGGMNAARRSEAIDGWSLREHILPFPAFNGGEFEF
jgi:hypothetical protein